MAPEETRHQRHLHGRFADASQQRHACSSPQRMLQLLRPHTRIDITEEQDAWIIRSTLGTKRDSERERERYTKCEDLKNCACAGTRLDIDRGKRSRCHLRHLPHRAGSLQLVPFGGAHVVEAVPQICLPGVHRRVYEQERLRAGAETDIETDL